jgi:Uma2 family endonuclease
VSVTSAIPRERRAAEDDVVVLRDATWADYQRLLELRGDRSVPRLSFLQGALEIMTPSRFHEALKSLIGQLVEAWCLERGIVFSAYGSWTLESKETERGIEPDECYVFGEVAEPARPDLAIEVAWTPPRIDKLAIYARLGVPEVWIWRGGRISVHVLRGDGYEESPASEVLPSIDLGELASFLDRPTASQAIREYRKRLAEG